MTLRRRRWFVRATSIVLAAVACCSITLLVVRPVPECVGGPMFTDDVALDTSQVIDLRSAPLPPIARPDADGAMLACLATGKFDYHECWVAVSEGEF